MDVELVRQLRDNPHKLGHLLGYTKLTELHGYWIKFLWYPTEYFVDNWEKTVDYFNNLGATFDSQTDEGIVREKLTKKSFFSLLTDRRSLQAHRGSYKSTSIIIVGCILRMLFYPNRRIGIIRKDFTKASRILKNISAQMKKKIIKELFYQVMGIFPVVVKDSDSILEYNFKGTITEQGNINAYGIHNSITGSHVDDGILDDFITLEDRLSKAEREKTRLRVEEFQNNVLNPDGLCMFVGTPWHKDDAWQDCPNPLKFSVYILNIFSEEEKIKRRAKTSNTTWLANYELILGSNDECLFKDFHFARWEFFYKNGVGFLDKKYSGVDTNALLFVAKKKDGRFQATGWIFDENIKTKLEWIKEKWEKYKIGTIFMEENDDKGFTADLLNQMGVMAETYWENKNKHRKIQDHALESGFFDLIDWDIDTDPRFLQQIAEYVEGFEPDDAPDVLGNAGRKLISLGNSIYVDRWSYLREGESK